MNKSFKVGDKVVPITKSLYCPLEKCDQWKKAQKIGQNFLRITSISDDGDISCMCDENKPGGNIYSSSDLELYEDDQEDNQDGLNFMEVTMNEIQDLINTGFINKNGTYLIRKA